MSIQEVIQTVQQLVALDGQMIVVANDGRYLGLVTGDLQHPESINNPYGEYGSATGMYSTQNPCGLYGGTNAIYSPYNPHTLMPPNLVVNQQPILVLTANQTLSPTSRMELNFLLGLVLGATCGQQQVSPYVQMALSHQQQQHNLQMQELQDYARARADAARLMNSTIRF
jgi:hypothetical protein